MVGVKLSMFLLQQTYKQLVTLSGLNETTHWTIRCRIEGISLLWSSSVLLTGGDYQAFRKLHIKFKRYSHVIECTCKKGLNMLQTDQFVWPRLKSWITCRHSLFVVSTHCFSKLSTTSLSFESCCIRDALNHTNGYNSTLSDRWSLLRDLLWCLLRFLL